MSPIVRAIALGLLLPMLSNTNAPSERVVLRQSLSHGGTSMAGGAISADGRFVAVASMARLLSSDQNSLDDIYVLDRETRTLTLETGAVAGASSNGSSGHPQLSADGQYLVFESLATNLSATPDRNDVQDIFVRDRLTGTTKRVSAGRAGEEANGESDAPAISGDGRFVAFVSSATNLVTGEDANGVAPDIYLVRLATGETTRVSVDTAGRQYASSIAPRLSGDGRLIVFAARERAPQRGESRSAATGTEYAVYVRDNAAAVTTCVSCEADTSKPRRAAFMPDLSADGRIVVFAMLTGPHPQRTDVAVHDRLTSATTVVTRRANARSAAPRVSADGRMIVFESWASDLLCDRRCSAEDLDDNVLPDIYLFDRDSARFKRVSGERRSWWSPSRAPSIDARGLAVVFSSREPFGPEDVTVDFDLFVCDPVCS